MATKFVRKQLLLDPQDLFYIQQIIKNRDQYTSLSQFVRESLKIQVEKKYNNKTTKKDKLLAKKGFIKTDGDGFEALNHNDIYKA